MNTIVLQSKYKNFISQLCQTMEQNAAGNWLINDNKQYDDN